MHRFLPMSSCSLALLSLVGQVPLYQPQPTGTGVISGTVRNADSSAGHMGGSIAMEIAINVEIQKEGRWTRLGGAAHTDAEGKFRLEGLPDGKYVVFAAFPMSMVRASNGLQSAGGSLLFAPGTPRASKARVIEVNGGKAVNNVLIQVPADSKHVISGQVFDHAAQPLVRGLVRMYASGEEGLSRATPVSPEGRFSFNNVSDEDYTVFASESGLMFPDLTCATTLVHVRQGSDPEPLILLLPRH